MTMNHLNTERVRYSSPHCISNFSFSLRFKEGIYFEICSACFIHSTIYYNQLESLVVVAIADLLYLNGICVARSCSEKPFRSITTEPKEEEIGEAHEKVDPMNMRSGG